MIVGLIGSLVLVAVFVPLFLRWWNKGSADDAVRALRAHPGAPIGWRTLTIACLGTLLVVTVTEALSLRLADALPVLPPEAALAGLAALVPVPLVMAGRLRRGWLWVACATAPCLFLAAAGAAEGAWTDLPPQLTVLLRDSAAEALLTPGAGLAAFLWVGGPGKAGWRRAWSFVAVYTLWAHALTLGLQLVAPGLLGFAALALLPVVAARVGPEVSWVGVAVRAIPRRPLAWCAVVAGGALSCAAAVLLSAAAAPGFDIANAIAVQLMHPAEGTELGRWLASLGSSTVFGAGLAVAAHLVDQAPPSGGALREVGSPDTMDPWVPPSHGG